MVVNHAKGLRFGVRSVSCEEQASSHCQTASNCLDLANSGDFEAEWIANAKLDCVFQGQL